MPTLAPRRAIAPVVHPGLQRRLEAAIPTPALPSRRRPDLPPWVPCPSPPGPESSARVVRERPANRRQSLCRALTHSRPQEESGFRHRTRPVVCRKTIWCRYWSGEVSQIALRTLQIVDQFLFAEVKGIHTIIGQMAEEIWPWHAGKLGGGTRRKLAHFVQFDGRSNTNPGRKDLRRRLQGKQDPLRYGKRPLAHWKATLPFSRSMIEGLLAWALPLGTGCRLCAMMMACRNFGEL